jgi:pimeloyl-ACP methyl ester carboxylesterase
MQVPVQVAQRLRTRLRLLTALLLVMLVMALRRRSSLPEEEFADQDSRFLDVNGLSMHYKRAGQGEPVLVLIHGSFLSLYSWRDVMQPLAQHGTVIAFDRPAFGLTSRPLPRPQDHSNPYSPEAQADVIITLLDRLGIQQAVLVGSSAGGTTAILAALRHPQRVRALVLVDAMVYSGYAVSEFPRWLRALLWAMGPPGALPVRLLIPLLHDKVVRSFWHDPSRLSPEVLARYRSSLHLRHWDQAWWRLVLSSHALDLEARLDRLRMPVLVVSGEHDRAVPLEQSQRLAAALPDAEMVTIPACGHLPHEECPETFLQAVHKFLSRLQ